MHSSPHGYPSPVPGAPPDPARRLPVDPAARLLVVPGPVRDAAHRPRPLRRDAAAAARRRQRRRPQRRLADGAAEGLARPRPARAAAARRACAARCSPCRSPTRSFEVVSAFDVIEHCDPEDDALARAAPGARARRPPARLRAGLPVGVDRPRRRERPPPPLHPAAGGRRARGRRLRGTPRDLRLRRRSSRCSSPSGPSARRATGCARAYAAGPADVVDVPAGRARRRAGAARACAGWDERVLDARDLPFGSSVFLAAVKP